jgi:hypothetical protein
MLNNVTKLHIHWVISWPLRSPGMQPSKNSARNGRTAATLEGNWNEVCSILESMQGLTELKIWLSYGPPYTMERTLLARLENIEVPGGIFILQLPHVPKTYIWPEMAIEKPGMPFTIERRSEAEQQIVADVYLSGGGAAFIEHRFPRHADYTIVKSILCWPWLLISCGMQYVAELDRRWKRRS